ncbi:FMN-binding negative transcriptional regulator [Danxiaibacter flavus]|uniref:FMN-binding negative transcriptional regulator n=1 Tax=Danxiaibacter flavus TaxID=3049108 RepID=A0ABV3ZCL3_9BACT|nr:FMN-binding negative transcriptional regulator [Chitinophagaceae bacterium DXS]
MYNLPYYKAADKQDVIAFMREHPFITLCGVDANNKPVATHIPVLISERDEKIFLNAHVMRKQDHTIAFDTNKSVLAIFTGPHTYVSASWYETKNVGSTWNYQVVHAHGTLRFLEKDELRQILTRLTDKFENNPHSPALVKHMTEDYMQDMMSAIIALEIEVTDIRHVFKLSQNRDEKSFNSIVDHLSSSENAEARAVADAMTKEKSKVKGQK